MVRLCSLTKFHKFCGIAQFVTLQCIQQQNHQKFYKKKKHKEKKNINETTYTFSL